MHRVNTIECVSEGRSFLLSTDAVSQIIEYDVAPLPLARTHVAGLGVSGAEVVISIILTRRAPPPERRRVTGALLTTKQVGPRWAIEISRVRSLVRARLAPPSGNEWLLDAHTDDGRKLPFFDVEHMLAALGAFGAAEGEP